MHYPIMLIEYAPDINLATFRIVDRFIRDNIGNTNTHQDVLFVRNASTSRQKSLPIWLGTLSLREDGKTARDLIVTPRNLIFFLQLYKKTLIEAIITGQTWCTTQ